VSVVVTLDGALFFLLGTRGFRKAFYRRKCLKDLKRQNARVKSLEENLSVAEARFSQLDHIKNQLEERKTLVAEQYQKRTLLNIEKAEKSWRSSRRSDELVADILSVNFRDQQVPAGMSEAATAPPTLVKIAQGTAS
jgi:uncharacterized protein YhaN